MVGWTKLSNGINPTSSTQVTETIDVDLTQYKELCLVMNLHTSGFTTEAVTVPINAIRQGVTIRHIDMNGTTAAISAIMNGYFNISTKILSGSISYGNYGGGVDIDLYAR